MLNDPTISVTCDKCGDTFDELEMTSLAGGGWDARNIPAVMRGYGWKVNGDEHICDECTYKGGDDADNK